MPILRGKNIPAPLALGVLVLTLLVYNFGGWYVYELALDLAERELERKLAAIATTAALEIGDEKEYPLLYLLTHENGLSVPESRQEWRRLRRHVQPLRNKLREIREINKLEEVLIIDKNHIPLVSADSATTPGTSVDYLDTTLIAETYTSGSITVSPYYEFEGQEHKRCYKALYDALGQSIGILQLSAGRENFAELHRIRAYLFTIAGAGSLLLLIVAFVLHHLLTRIIRTEEAMADNDRLQSLGTLAAGMAHEIRNPLGIIRAISEELKDEMETKSEQAELSSSIIEEVDRLNNLVSNFLTFAKPGTADRESFLISDTIEDVITLVSKDSRQSDVRIESEVQLIPQLHKIHQLVQRCAVLDTNQ